MNSEIHEGFFRSQPTKMIKNSWKFLYVKQQKRLIMFEIFIKSTNENDNPVKMINAVGKNINLNQAK